jgi:hypothetical protein
MISEIDNRVRALAKDVAGSAKWESLDDVHARLVRLFLGFLSRSYVYHYAKHQPAKHQQPQQTKGHQRRNHV